MAPDIEEDLEALASIEQEEDLNQDLLFDPHAFREVHSPLKMADHKMSHEQLRGYAI